MNSSTQIVHFTKDGQRIDNFLFTSFKGVPKRLIYRLLRTGKIRVNRKRVKQTYRVQTDDEVFVPNLYVSKLRTERPNIPDHVKIRVESSILYEDKSILVINKPAGLAVHSGTRVSYGVIEVLRALRPAASYLELAHRLDRETSGCLLIAKNNRMLNELHGLLRTRKVKKEYWALVKGRWSLGKKIINAPLQHKSECLEILDRRQNPMNLKTAITKFSPRKIYREFSLMNVKISTGRNHQIRIHSAQIRHPVVGDQKYGDFIFNGRCKKMGLKRMFLHASRVAFQCSGNGEKYNFSAPLDKELSGFLQCLESD